MSAPSPTLPIAYDPVTSTDQGLDEEDDKEWERTLIVTDEGAKVQMIKTTPFKFIYYTQAPDFHYVPDENTPERMGAYYDYLTEL
ncbi:MAG: hypothetical protein Q9184_007070 [Pyrenodesmia sp. 2 TL-2023]